MRAEPLRTTYLFDVRSVEEAAADPVPAATHALGVQLVQATDQWIGVRRARIVLCCDTGLRAAIAAFWLYQLGFDVAVAEIDDALRALPSATPPFAPPQPAAYRIAPTAARKALARGARLIDLRSSRSFREEHVVGAIWASRPRLDRLPHLTGTGLPLLLVSEAEAAAGQAAHDLRAAAHQDIAIVEGGHPALVRAGCAVETSPATPPDDECIDFLSFVHDRHDGNLDAMRRYLDWETGLVAQLDDAERAEYRLLSPAVPNHAMT